MEDKVYFKIQQKLSFYDYLKYFSVLKRIKALRIICAVLAVLSAAFLLYILNLSGWFVVRILCFLLIGELIGFFRSVHRKAAKTSYNAECGIQEQNPIDNEIIFCEGRFYSNRAHTTAYYNYHQIYKLKETKEHFFIMLSENQGIIVRMDSLVEGDVNDLTAFLRSKACKI